MPIKTSKGTMSKLTNEHLFTAVVQEFESLQKTDQYKKTFWYASDIQNLLGYISWDEFARVVSQAKAADLFSTENTCNFEPIIRSFRGSKRSVQDYVLNRHACYLVFQNASADKPLVAKLQNYLSFQTVKQGLIESGQKSIDEENDLRSVLRSELAHENQMLSGILKKMGVTEPSDYAEFQRAGYQGLYGGMTPNQIREEKGVIKHDPLPNHMGPLELLANYMRTVRIHEKLAAGDIKNVAKATSMHRQVGENVRFRLIAEKIDTPEQIPFAKK